MSPLNCSPREYYTYPSDGLVTPCVVSLRPTNDHAAMRRAAAAYGLRVLALSPWKIVPRDDAATRTTLAAALGADVVIVTSPAAARATAALAALHIRPGQSFCAVGSTTAAALRHAGISEVLSPARMDSDGLLALPVLQTVSGRDIGLLTAPGGRDRIAPALRERGARVHRADVYARQAIPLSNVSLARLRGCTAPLLLPLSSGEALQRVLAVAPDDIAARLRASTVLAASPRLATLAHAQGCRNVRIAAGPRPTDLLAAAFERGSG